MVKLNLNNTGTLVDNSFIISGAALRIRWMRYRGRFPAKEFLSAYPEDLQAFLARAEEMADRGKLTLGSKGHWLTGKHYSSIFEFKMPVTRAFGFRDGNVLYITNAAKKADTVKAQTPDYERAMKLRADFLKRAKK